MRLQHHSTPPMFTCPRCGSATPNENDIRQGYCGHCHDWTGQESRLYGCPLCGIQFTVPPEHGELVLCGAHSPPGRMIPARTITADQAASGPLTWNRPDSDPLADIWQARGLIERYAEAHPDPDCTAGDIVRALHGAGLSATAEFSADLTPEQLVVACQAMAEWDRAREVAAGRQRTRREHHQNLQQVNRARRRQVLDSAEALIARLDGEGYGVQEKARLTDAAEGTLPPEYLDANHAMSWRQGDPAL